MNLSCAIPRLAVAATLLLTLAACEREQRRFDTPPAAPAGIDLVQVGTLRAGPQASAVAASSAAPASAVAAMTASGAASGPFAASGSSMRAVALGPLARNPHEENAYAVAQGKRFFRWYNCGGCHANGGGNMGPALMDDKWIYGSRADQIVATILQGRPNGMPSFAGRIPEDQVWQIAAYVRSMSGQLRTDVAPSRGDSLSSGPPEGRRDELTPRPAAEPPNR
jgi:cytochrome c oxidase cbb3-type subunit 3